MSHITSDEVLRHLKLTGPDEHIALIVDSVNSMLDEWHGDTWPAGVHLGAVMLAARLHRRRNSSAGVEAFGDMGAAYVSRYDSDLDRQLRINDWTPPLAL